MILIFSFRVAGLMFPFPFIFRLSYRAHFSSIRARTIHQSSFYNPLLDIAARCFFFKIEPITCSSHILFDFLDIISAALLVEVLTRAEQVSRAREAAGGHRCERSRRHNGTSRLEPMAADSNSLPTWRRRRRLRNCRWYDARRRSKRRHLTARWLTIFTAAVLFKNFAAKIRPFPLPSLFLSLFLRD